MTAMIGARIRRLEDRALLIGRGRFIDDVPLPGALHVAFVRSPHPHARIAATDLKAASAVPGVHAVLDFAALQPVLAEQRLPRHPEAIRQPPKSTPFVLAREEVAFVGEPVALIAASDRYVAEDAAQQVTVQYEELPAVADLHCALDRDAPKARLDFDSNLLARFRVAYGDSDAAFAGAKTVRAALAQHRGAAHPIEPRGAAVEYRASEDALVIWASTQLAHELRDAVAAVLGLDESRVRVATPDVGGGFGPKYCVYQEEVAVACAARLLQRPLKWTEDRREHFLSAIQERDQSWDLELALAADGRIRGLRGTILHDQGAYALKDVGLPYNSATSVAGPYKVPALAIDVAIVLTNKVASSSVRGAGYPEACFAMERLMDRAAEALGIERAELRRRNLVGADEMPYRTPLKARSGAAIVYDSGDYPACQAAVLAAARWNEFPARQARARAEGRYLGIGLAHAVKGTGRGPFESGLVQVSPQGRISVLTGAALMGQGLGTALAQICAAELGVAPDDVTVIAGDTRAPYGFGGFASRQLVTAGSSVRLAAREVAAKAKRLASHILEADETDLELAEGAVRIVGVKDRAVPLKELARILKGAPGRQFPAGIEPGLEAARPFMSDSLAYANACHVAEVEVDVETGAVRLLAYHAIQDSGTLINPLIVKGQLEGGIAHGLGNALFERMGYGEAQPMTLSFAEYLLPTAPEVPRVASLFKQSPSPLNPLGAKGAGEVSTIPTAAAIAAAIEDALQPFRVRIERVPLAPYELRALIAKETRHG
jgi:aerobic carbon-monoxide dehydrogenase large subunit